MRAGIALGSNLGDRLQNLRNGRDALLALPGISGPLLASRVYETEPVGTSPDAGAFLNAVIELEFNGTPKTLLAELQQIEASTGRPSRRPRNAPRTLDLDILYLGHLILAEAELEIPHPRLHLRRFVLQPLHDIRPDLILPTQTTTIRELLATHPDPAAVTDFAAL